MRFHMHLLPTYFPDRDPPFAVFYQQVLDQIALAEELGWECFWFTEHHFLLYGGPIPNPAAIMCAAAARTSRIHLGSAISRARSAFSSTQTRRWILQWRWPGRRPVSASPSRQAARPGP